MCDKNCGSGGTDVCTCRCLQVMAYKSKGGTIFEKKEDCQKANVAFDKEQDRKRQEIIASKAYNVLVTYSAYRPRMSHYNYDSDRVESYIDRGFLSALYSLKGNWRDLREALNGIQD